MKSVLTKTTVLFLFLIISTFVLCSCNDDVATTGADTTVPFVITVDGKTITVENPSNKTLKELLKKSNIKLNDGDIVSVDTDSVISEGTTVHILRKCTVTIKNELTNTENTLIVVGATIKDAIADAGIELPKNYSMNYKLSDHLFNDIEIIISEKEETTEETTTEEATEQENSNSNNNTQSDNNTQSNNRPATTRPAVTQPAVTKPATTTPPTTKPEPTTSGRTIVSVEIYEDCDGSGHGVKVITYSDGTQEEVPF